MLLKILLGLVGLGVVVFVHELGHFIAARLVGIDVEAFSIGWGRPLYKRTMGGVEYRIGVFPVGGYCRMRGEAEFREALTNEKSEIPRDKGTFYGASPGRRIITAFAGPAANVLFAIFVLTIVWGIGFDVRTMGNRIVLASEIDPGTLYPADQGGLKTGDRIVAIDGNRISNFLDIQETIAQSPGQSLKLTVERDGQNLGLSITPQLDKSTGAGKVGVYFWNDPIIEAVKTGSSAAIAGLLPGDLIVSANGKPIPYTVALNQVLKDRPTVLSLEINRQGSLLRKDVVLSYADDGSVNLGIDFKVLQFHTPRLSIPRAIQKGTLETWKTLTVSIKSLALLFKGIDLTKAVSGPVRITYMVGEVATESFGQGVGAGLSAVGSFLALISIALCIMNLLPIPALDGGLIILFIIEAIRRKPLHPKAVYLFQMVGATVIFGLLIFSVFGDILFLFGQH